MCHSHTHTHTHTHTHELGVPVFVQTTFPFSPSIISYWRWHCVSVCLPRALTVKRFFFFKKGCGVWIFSPIETYVCSVLNGKITGRLRGLKRVR